MFLESEVWRLKFKAAPALSDSGCLKSSCSVDIAMPPQFALVFWIRALFTSLSDFWPAKLIGTERQVDEQKFNH